MNPDPHEVLTGEDEQLWVDETFRRVAAGWNYVQDAVAGRDLSDRSREAIDIIVSRLKPAADHVYADIRHKLATSPALAPALHAPADQADPKRLPQGSQDSSHGKPTRGRATLFGRLSWLPDGIGRAADIITLVLFVLAAIAFARTHLSAHHHNARSATNKNTGPRTSSAKSAVPLVPNAASSCASAEALVASLRPIPTFVGSPGQLGGGVNIVEERLLPSGTYADVVRATAGDQIEMSIELSNTAYGSIQNLVVKVQLVPEHSWCWRATASASSKVTPGGNAKLGSVYVLLPKARPTTVNYVPRSTKLYPGSDEKPVNLKDGILEAGLPLPYQLTGGTTWFVNFLAEVR